MSRLIISISVVLLSFGHSLAASGQNQQQAEWATFDFYNKQYVLVRGTVNGHETDMILDTGAQVSLIDKSFAKRVGARRGKKLKVRGVGGRAKAYAARNVKVSVGALPVELSTVALVDMSSMSIATGRSINFILGVESLINNVVDIDYPNRRIAFRTAKDFDYIGSGRTIEVKPLKRGRHAIEASIERREPGWYLIDTGSHSTATIFAAFATQQRLLDNRAPISASVSGGIGGLTMEMIASVEDFTVGGFELSDMPIAIPADDEGPPTSEDFDGILGNEVLSRFRVIFDYSRHQIHMEPGPDWQTLEFSRSLIGLSALPQADRLKVIFVAPGSPAAHAGWQDGMFVTAVDQFSGTGPELQTRLRELSRAAPGTKITLLDHNGIEHSVLLARYY